MSAESDSLFSPEHEPTRALLLAQALETCIQAERRIPGSADHIIARQPAWARGELRRLVALAGSLDAAATSAVMSDEFRVAARARLMQRIAPGLLERHVERNGHAVVSDGARLTTLPSRNSYHTIRGRRGRRKWLWRGGLGGLFAAVLVAAATLTASASALPGDALYGVKQVREELGVRFAPNDDARALALLQAANTRLDETARLLQQGRTDQVAQTTQQYDDALNRATVTYVVTIAPAAPPTDRTAYSMQTTLGQQQQQLQTLLDSAPETTRADLHEALVAAERSQALVADPHSDTVVQRASRPSSAAAAPTMAAEVEPTSVPVLSAPPPVDIVAQPTPLPIADTTDRHEGRDVAQHGERDVAEVPTAVAVVVAHAGGQPVVTARSVNAQSSQRDEVRVQDAQVPDVAEEDDVRPSSPVTASGNAIDAKEPDRVVAPSPNQDDGHARVAEQTQPAATVAQRQSGTTTAAKTAQQQSQTGSIAQTSSGGSGHASTRDAGDTSPAATTRSGGSFPSVEPTPTGSSSGSRQSGSTQSSSGTQSSGSGEHDSGGHGH
jgi:hypothetical protein